MTRIRCCLFLFGCEFLAVSIVLAQRPLGTDVSGYQPSVNWTAVKNGGVAFAWAKATEGTGYVNGYFTAQEAGAQSVGIYIGAYHFARPSIHPNVTGANSADSEAGFFWSVASNYVKFGGAFLVPMLDWEDPNMTNQLSAATLSAWVNEWCYSVSNSARSIGVTGVRPVVYTGTWYSRPSATYSGLTTAVTIWPAWIAAYPSNPNPQTGGPSDTYPWSSWKIWQYADTNWSGGDADVYNGTLSSFVQTFVIGGTNAPVLLSSPTNFVAVEGGAAAFAVQASGLPPLAYQWFFNGSSISGATASTYTIANAQLGAAGSYTVTVSNSYGSFSSASAFLAVVAPLTNSPGAIPAPSGLVDWWPAEGNPEDLAGPYAGTPAAGFSYVPGEEGLAFHFDGSSGYLSTGAPSLSAPWTVCLWVNRQNAPGTSAALLSDGTYSLKLEQYNGTRKVGLTQLGVGDYTFNYTAPAGAWTHLAFVGTGSQTLLYANGVLQGGLTNSVPLPRGYIGATYVASGGRFVDYLLAGVDEVMCFNRALSGGEIGAIANAGRAGLIRAPEFTSVAALGGGGLRLALQALTGKTVTIHCSTNLLNWTSLVTLPNPTGVVSYTDTSPVLPQKYYRASQP
ncbi:MAG TPA: GH25 family lysozyme [Verrucomicrobiae bacterium]|nr:GH25 family lysozyme [Verrucomicrobiae bacterium]